MSGWLSLLLTAVTFIADGEQIVVVRPSEWAAAVRNWKTFREQEGFQITEVEALPTAEETRLRIQSVLEQRVREFKPSSKLPSIVIMADAPTFRNRNNASPSLVQIPSFYVNSEVVVQFGSEPTIVTDQPYADWDGDGKPEAIVGRIPAQSSQQLEHYLQRVVDFEKRRHVTRASREIDVVAGVGDFGLIADTVIEGLTKQLLTNDLPETFVLSMTQASSKSVYCPSPRQFRQSVLQRLNDGGLFWVYLGHGFVDTLDYLRFTDPPIPILDRNSIGGISIPHDPPIAIFLACYVGAFDASVPSLSEQMLLEVDGPIAAIASSRVTMPYAMGVLGDELLQQCFQEKPIRAGSLFASAKSKMLFDAPIYNNAESSEIDQASPDKSNVEEAQRKADAESEGPNLAPGKADTAKRELMDGLAKALSPEGHSLEKERREHSFLFNFLGDPTILIRQPERLDFDGPEKSLSTNSIVLRGQAPWAGKLTAELVYRRIRLPDRVKELRNASPVSDLAAKQQAVYEAANDLTAAQVVREVKGGSFEITIPSNENWQGNYLVRLTLEGDSVCAVGVRQIRVESPK